MRRIIKHIILVFLFIHSSNGIASTIYEKVELFTNLVTFTEPFDIELSGSYLVTVTDFTFPTPIYDLGLNITDSSTSFGHLLDAGELTVDLTPGTYYLSFFAISPQTISQYGLSVDSLSIGETVETSAVPLPAPLLLLATGLIGMSGFVRISRRSKTN